LSSQRSSSLASSSSNYSISSVNSDPSSKSPSILSTSRCSETLLEEGSPKQAGNSNISLYKPVDLPKDFELPNKFGKKIDKALKDYKMSGSVPPDVTKRVVRQIADHIEAENPTPSKKTIEWIAWTYCLKYPGLKTANPLDIFGGNAESKTSQSFNEWVGIRLVVQYLGIKKQCCIKISIPTCETICFTVIASKGVLAEKLRRALENRRYQDKRKSVKDDQNQFEVKKQKTQETDEGKSDTMIVLEIIFLA